ncbi:hypothetical protein HYH03_002524 [Edaphochlamys debaryana]|uniref:Uncharacterized protein n=1 Tax=Edaphochlamys debaryana TaxID=47281 RepID=A0A835YET0_9CHLO|nr:hypothetical protein HYH03_002524 [Edaphochlamys debaryana]|eukprot:KAG2499581.1 hypothetical protein HYH03_002524 [Edaphochlamys debaryana]
MRPSFLAGLAILLMEYLVCSTSTWDPERIAILLTETYGHVNHTTHKWRPYPEHTRFLDLGMRTKVMYAEKHGYDLKIVTSLPDVTIKSKTNKNAILWQRGFWIRRQFGSKAEPGQLAPDNDTVASCRKVMWMDGDIFITNLTVRIEDIIEAARRLRPDGSYPHFIATRHAELDGDEPFTPGQILQFNTGTALVRCSTEGLRLMNEMLFLRIEQAFDTYVQAWDHQGALMQAYKSHRWVRSLTTFVPPKLMNAYPFNLTDETGELKDCGDPQGTECQKGWWTPGDFLIHFPGAGKHYIASFLKRYPLSTWPGACEPFNF